MSDLSEQEAQVGRHYDENIFEYENARSLHCPVEFAITARQIESRIPDNALVAEIGVGSGYYSELLAGRTCKIHLVDVSARLLDTAWSRLRANGFHDQIIGIDQASATNLDCLPSAKFDAVLMLGPLYHLCALEERQRAVDEASRILKTGGLLFAAGINRLAYLRDLFRESPQEVLARREFHRRYLTDGNLDPAHAPPIGFANLTTTSEFRNLFSHKFKELALLGVESFTSVWQQTFSSLSEEQAMVWLDLVEQTSAMPEALGASDHFLFIGEKSREGDK